jgi:hypothetical protein
MRENFRQYTINRGIILLGVVVLTISLAGVLADGPLGVILICPLLALAVFSASAMGVVPVPYTPYKRDPRSSPCFSGFGTGRP